jgi:hypothetical protein
MKQYKLTAGELIALIDRALGNVYLAVEDGVCFNLNSKLSQLYCIRMLLDQSGGEALSPRLKFERPEDETMFQKYLYNKYTKLQNISK